jgi:hypothetical protein
VGLTILGSITKQVLGGCGGIWLRLLIVLLGLEVAGLGFFMRVGAKKGSHTAYVEEGFPRLL